MDCFFPSRTSNTTFIPLMRDKFISDIVTWVDRCEKREIEIQIEIHLTLQINLTLISITSEYKCYTADLICSHMK